jgi:DNA-binding MarR family transcriptional regulator
MLSAIHRTVREQLTLRHLLAVAAVLGLLWFVVDVTRELLVGFGVALLVGEVVTILQNTPEIDQRFVKAGIGLAVVLGSSAMGYSVLTGGTGVLWLPAILLLFGTWLLIDTVADLYHGRQGKTGQRDDLSSADLMLLMSHSHLLASELQAGPRTRKELATECDLTASRVDQALEHLVDSGVVDSERDRYILREERTGLRAFARTIARGVCARITRPFRASA